MTILLKQSFATIVRPQLKRLVSFNLSSSAKLVVAPSLSKSSRLGFIGLGSMGRKMVSHLKNSGGYESLTIHDSNSKTTKSVAKETGTCAGKNLKDVASKSDIVISMLPNDAAITVVAESLLAEKLKAKKNDQKEEGFLLISCGTISPTISRRLALDYSNNGFTFVSAPVFARPDGLAKKQATWMVGGEQQGRVVATSILSLMGNVVDFGEDVGAANVVKLCGNFLIAASIEAIAESMALAEKSGVDREKVMNLLSSTIFDCLIYKGYGQRVSQRDHRPGGFSLTLGAKDVALVSQAARDSDVPMPFLSILNDRFTSAKARGRGEFDWSAIGLSVAEDAGVDVTNDAKRNIKDIKDGRTY